MIKKMGFRHPNATKDQITFLNQVTQRKCRDKTPGIKEKSWFDKSFIESVVMY